jgi:predicted ATP-binding protein involved in virulence
MKILGLTLKNFRGIDDLILDFSDSQTTVLIGANGAGKSSILDAIGTMFGLRIHDLSDKLRDAETEYIEHVQTRFIDYQRILIPNDVKNGFDGCDMSMRVSFLSKEEQWPLHYEITGPTSSRASFSRQLPDFPTKIDKLLSQHSKTSIPIIVYYPVDRKVVATPLGPPADYKLHQLTAYDGAISPKIDFKNFFEWYRAREDLENEQIRAKPAYRDGQLEAVRNAVYRLVPGFADLGISRSPYPTMTIKKDGNELNILQLSDGEKCVLAMVGDIARRLAIANPSLADPLLGDGVVLIDEIDLHLHPRWQREVIPGLERTFPKCQFIVATHSPQVLSSAKNAVVYLLMVIDGMVKAKKLRGPYGKDTNTILGDIMDVDERPAKVKERISAYFDKIHDNDLEAAEDLRKALARDIGEDDPDLIRGEVLTRRKEILAK